MSSQVPILLLKEGSTETKDKDAHLLVPIITVCQGRQDQIADFGSERSVCELNWFKSKVNNFKCIRSK